MAILPVRLLNADADVVALVAKVGGGVSGPTLDRFLIGTGAGTSAWGLLQAAHVLVALGYTPADAVALAAHIANVTNPHAVTKAQVGLANVDNTSDANKPISTAQAAGLQASDVDLAALAGLAGVQGDVIYRDATQWQRLPKGTAGQRLTMNSGATAPEWQTPAAQQDTGTIVIAGGVVTLPAVTPGVAVVRLEVDTQGGAATDDLDTINITGTVADTTFLVVQTLASARDVVLTDSIGNLQLAGNCTLGTLRDTITLMRRNATAVWLEVARSLNG